MTRLVLVRHGETEFNRTDRFRGRLDVPLNETGLRQAERAGQAIMDRFDVSAIYSSPLSRAMKTAEAIGRVLGLAVQPLPAIVDFSYGEWEGKSYREVEAAYPESYRFYLAEPHRAVIPGGESLRRLRRRVAAAVKEMAAAHPDETVVMVSHRMVCRMLVCYLLGLGNRDLWRVELDTASISLFEQQEPGWVMLQLNDTCHLPTRLE